MNATACNALTTNPEITGVGIRVSIYVQSILSSFIVTFAAIFPKVGFHEMRSAIKASLITGLSTLVCAFILLKTGDGLSLVDQLLIITLSSLQTAAVVGGLWKLLRKHKETHLQILYILFLLLQYAFGFIVWSHTRGLEWEPGDCLAYFVIFGVSVAVTNVYMQGFAFAMLAGAALHLLWVLFKTAKNWLLSDSSPDLEANTVSSELQTSTSEDSPRKLRRNFYLGLIPKAYAIITAELILSRNNVRSATSTWTFGQTLAVLLLLSQIGDLFSLVRKCMSAAEAEKAERKDQNEDVPKANVEVKGDLSCDQKDAVVISVPVDEALESVRFPRPSRRS